MIYTVKSIDGLHSGSFEASDDIAAGTRAEEFAVRFGSDVAVYRDEALLFHVRGQDTEDYPDEAETTPF